MSVGFDLNHTGSSIILSNNNRTITYPSKHDANGNIARANCIIDFSKNLGKK